MRDSVPMNIRLPAEVDAAIRQALAHFSERTGVKATKTSMVVNWLRAGAERELATVTAKEG